MIPYETHHHLTSTRKHHSHVAADTESESERWVCRAGRTGLVHLEGLVGGVDGDRDGSDGRQRLLQLVLVSSRRHVHEAGVRRTDVRRLEVAPAVLTTQGAGTSTTGRQSQAASIRNYCWRVACNVTPTTAPGRDLQALRPTSRSGIIHSLVLLDLAGC